MMEQAPRSRLRTWTQRSRAWRSKNSYDKVDSPVCRMAIIEDPDGNKLIIHKLKPENEKGVCK